MTSYFGKYRGKVENNVDPHQRGRLQVSVPAVTGEGKLNWALPCTPYGGDGVGLWAIPPVGASVWVEYEGGDSGRPIWTGCFWEDGQAPASPAVPEVVMLKTATCMLTLNDAPGAGGITIETSAGMKISLNAQGVEITDGAGGTISLQGPRVTINDGALEVL